MTKDDLSEYLEKFQRLQRICMGCEGFDVYQSIDMIYVKYIDNIIAITTDMDRDLAVERYNDFVFKLKKDNWL